MKKYNVYIISDGGGTSFVGTADSFQEAKDWAVTGRCSVSEEYTWASHRAGRNHGYYPLPEDPETCNEDTIYFDNPVPGYEDNEAVCYCATPVSE